jgi:hypothetical protein
VKRYYITRRIGTGVPGAEDPYRCELMQWLIDNGHNIQPIKIVISHTFPYVLTKYDLTDAVHASAVTALPNMFAIPPGALDRTVGNLTVQQRNAIRNRLTLMGLSSAWVVDNNTVRDICNYIARSVQFSEWLDVQISAGSFDTLKTVADISTVRLQKVVSKLTALGIDLSWVTGSTRISDICNKIQECILRDGNPPMFNDKDTD